MAKSSRSSTRKANNQRLKANVFGPVESARAERLSAKLLEIAAQPKPSHDGDDMKVVEDVDAAAVEGEDDDDKAKGAEATMEVDSAKPPITTTSSSSKKNRVSKRRKTSKIVFPKYKDRRTSKKGKN